MFQKPIDIPIFHIQITEAVQYVLCMLVSVALFVTPMVIWAVQVFLRRLHQGHPTQKKNGVIGALWFTGFFVAAALVLRYAVSCYGLVFPAEGESVGGTMKMQFFESIFRAFRSVGIAEDYVEVMVTLKRLCVALFPFNRFAVTVVMGYATILHLALPVAGSVLILSAFAKIFPTLQLRFKYWDLFRQRREVCYFSRLSPQSLALAKSLLLSRRKEQGFFGLRPLLVFCDAYVDDESEIGYELMLEAKQLGAICVRDDLPHVPKATVGTRRYFLMEEDEYANLPALMGLMEEQNVAGIKKAFIYLFVQSDMYVRLEQNIRQRLMDKTIHGSKALTEEELPEVIPVHAHRNLVNNLMVDVPLYEPLVGQNKNSLNVTIFGNGSIGTEAFLSTYWFGQMLVCRENKLGEDVLEECALTIHVVSQDDEDDFWANIDRINPEIRRTIRCKEDEKEDPILLWREGENPNNPYCRVQYHKADVKTGVFGSDAWLDADYIIVALGSDEDNIKVADKLRTHIGKMHLENKGDAENTVIAYVVYNSELCQALNARNAVEYGIYMYAFGHLNQVYSTENVFMSKTQLLAEETHKAYHGDAATHSVRGNRYDQQGDMARAMHVKYKLFSLGWITTSLFVSPADVHAQTVQNVRLQYRRVAVVGQMHAPHLHAADVIPPCGKGKQDLTTALLSEQDLEKWEDLCKKRHMLAWLEHRRWSAYTRTMGFRHSDAMRQYYLTEDGHKNMTLKLHPCLVEARRPSEDCPTFVAWEVPQGEDLVETYALRDGMDEDTLWQNNPHMDLLDMYHVLRWQAMADTWDVLVGMHTQCEQDVLQSDDKDLPIVRLGRLQEQMIRLQQCKKYDYFIGEYPSFVLASEALAALQSHFHIDAQTWNKECEKWKARGAFLTSHPERTEWVIPTDCVHDYIRRKYRLCVSTKECFAGADGLPEPFAFAYGGNCYAQSSRRNRALVEGVKKAYRVYVRQTLCAQLEQERDDKSRVKADQ